MGDEAANAAPLASSQRLAQAHLQLCAICPADARAVAVLQNEIELAVRNGLKLQDAIYVHDGGPMNADEPHGIETSGQLVQCSSVEQFFASDVQIHIDSGAFNPVDVGDPNKARRATPFHHQAIQIAASLRSPG